MTGSHTRRNALKHRLRQMSHRTRRNFIERYRAHHQEKKNATRRAAQEKRNAIQRARNERNATRRAHLERKREVQMMKHQEKERRMQLQAHKRTEAEQRRAEAEQRRAERQAIKGQQEDARRQRQEEKRILLEQRREEKRLEKERIEEERRMEKEPAPLSYEEDETLERNLLRTSLSKKNRQSAVHQLQQSMQKNLHQPSVAQSRARPGNLGAKVFNE